ncbi:MAG: hypothetical protein AAGA03_18420 [Planctomycetota bacterium]
MPNLHDRIDRIEDLPTDLVEAIRQAPVPGLGDGPNDAGLSERLRAIHASGGMIEGVASEVTAGVISGLWLLAGDLDRSHDLSQSIKTPEGSFWHGIMHRREGDFGNSKYWFRLVGEHPVLDQLSERTDFRDPFDFVDRVQACVQGRTDDAGELAQIQWVEWQLLMRWQLT